MVAQQFNNDLYILNLDTLTWTKKECNGACPERRYSHAFCSIGSNKILSFGGSGLNGVYYNQLHILDISNWTWTKIVPKGAIPAGRNGFAFAVFENRFYVHGGDQGQGI